MRIKLLSWNVNGLRALMKKPQWDWFKNSDAQIIGLQETKAQPEQLPEEALTREGWNIFWDSSTVKKGYSGVSVYSRLEPVKVEAQLPDLAFQGEGRLLHLEFPKFHLFNGYFPNGGADVLDEDGKPTGDFKRLPYKMGFFNSFLKHVKEYKKDKPVIVCGDFNIAHQAIDLSDPRGNEHVTGYLPQERAWMDEFMAAGFVDTFRHVHGDLPEQYTWWSYRTHSRKKNVGWRLDYFFVSSDLVPAIRDAWICKDVLGSDHCPVGLSLEI